MADTTLPTISHEDLDSGFGSRAALTTGGLTAEGMKVMKIAIQELVDVADSAAQASFKTIDGLADEFGGPLANLVKLPAKAAAGVYDTASSSARRLLDVA